MVSDSHSFPFGIKAVLELIPGDNGTYKYKILKTERFDDVIDIMEVAQPDNKYLTKAAGENTIELIICRGTMMGRDNISKTVLIQRPNITGCLEFDALIKQTGSNTKEATSVHPICYSACGIELWPYHIEEITLSGYRVSSNP